MVWSTSKKKEKYCETFWKRFREETENTEREELLNFKARLINELLIELLDSTGSGLGFFV